MMATGLIKAAGTVSDGKFNRRDSRRQYPNAQRSELLLFIITVEKYEPFHIFPLISNLKVKIAFSLLVLLLHYRILCSQHNFCLLASPTLLKYHVTAINTIAV